MRAHRKRPNEGIAMVIVLLAITLITAVVVQFSYDAHIDYSLAANEADETRAFYLAKTGVELYKLILTADEKIADNPQLQQLMSTAGMGGIQLWKMVPEIDTAMLRAMGSPDVPSDQKEEMKKRFGGIAFDTLGQKGGFLDFEGDFHASIEDEEKKTNLNAILDCGAPISQPLDSCVGRALYAMTLDEKYDPIFDGLNSLGERKLARQEVIANIIDWIDPNTQMLVGGGAEDSLYTGYDEPYHAKNAKLDTLGELNMVRGVDDDFMAAFGDELTVFGSGKVNVNTCSADTLASLLLAFADSPLEVKAAGKLADQIIQYRDLSPFSQPHDFENFLEKEAGIRLRRPPGPNGQPNPAALPVIDGFIEVTSKTFTIRSTGFAGEARTTITAVVDNTAPGSLHYLYFRVN